MSEEKTLWGIPIVVSDQMAEGEIILGRFPTAEEVQEHGSVENAIEAQKHAWAKIKGIPTE